MLDDVRSGNVAIIEDDPVCRCALGRLLQAGGFEPALFESAEVFFGSWTNRRWLCLIVDVQLAGISGIELQERLRDAGSEVPVIITTGNRANLIRERAQQAGCAAFLWKPVNPETILALVGSIACPPHPDRKNACTNGQ
jgi:FixJ family two-component response regulator